MSCKDCPDRASCCWSNCEKYKADRAEIAAKKKYLQSFNCKAAGNTKRIITIADRKERKKRQ